MNKNNMSQVKSSEVKSNQNKSYTHMMIRIRIRIVDGRKLRIIIRVNIIITIKLRIIGIARVITIIIRMRISAMTIEKQ